jgi:hypothetical protein
MLLLVDQLRAQHDKEPPYAGITLTRFTGMISDPDAMVGNTPGTLKLKVL